METAKKEIALWFKEGELNNYCCANNSWVYNTINEKATST